MNITAGKQVGELATSYEKVRTVLEQATIMKNTNKPIVVVRLLNPIIGDDSGQGTSIADQISADMQADLDGQFITKLQAQLAAIETEYSQQLTLATDEAAKG